MDYQIVGSFAVQDETTDSISEAVLKLRNPLWKQKLYMVDDCEEEIERNIPGKSIASYTNFIS